MPKIEICLDSVESIIASEQGGADRVEFCSDLFEGGLTPSLGMFKVAKGRTAIPINVMIRPRGGDFCYSDLEFEAMKEDARLFKEAGANALVFGILTPEGKIDKKRSRELIAIARPLPVTFHRAFDMTSDPFEAIEDLIELGVERVLTSGGEASVLEGADLLARLIKEYGNRIVIMPGAGITKRNFEKIHSIIKADEYHLYLHSEQPSKMVHRKDHVYMGGLLRQEEYLVQHTDQSRVEAMIALVR
ncbi:MAG TPA: copper homeostasis protein CutC [Sphaerochaeta sp.]|jgi:copper homeostasis protein|nr:copper homeostasis protein CutC [Sphaerochaeta sp.]HPY45026.1 copper homeostasis protein CutC [Sphaerochaeta sp.]HQB04479.1 copper homeostasis protein CutC [Sphaerochaeta sp.]